jgi:large subunit ribosomal protein L23
MSIIIKPIITEKATTASELNNCYSFLVNTKANKVEIKKAVEAAYGVSVQKVRTMNYGPERKTKFTKTGVQQGKTNAIKRPLLKLPKAMPSTFIITFKRV